MNCKTFSDKSGFINSLEFQDILSVIDIKLTPDAYEQILKEGDLDSSYWIFTLVFFLFDINILINLRFS